MSTPSDACQRCDGLARRDFLASSSLLAIAALTSACGADAIGDPGEPSLFPQAPLTLDPRTIPALQAVGGRVVITQGLSSPVFIERIGPSDYLGLSLVCPHRGSIVEPRSGGFRCPNHGATFTDDGRWTSGQPTTDLAPVTTRLNPDGTLTIGGRPAPPLLGLSSVTATFTATSGSTLPVPVQRIAISNTNGGTLRNIQAVVAHAAGQPTGWLTATLDRALAPNTLTLAVDPTRLPAGAFAATVTVTSPDATNGPVAVAITLAVRDPEADPVLRLSASSLRFSGSPGVAPAAQIVLCSNAGGGTVSGLAARVTYPAGSPSGWLSASLDRTSAPAELSVRATPTNLAVGSYTATVIVSASGMAERSVSVTYDVVPAGLTVILSQWPTLATIGGVAGPVGQLDGNPVAVARLGAAAFGAVSMRCPHQGGTVAVINNTSFRCPNHGALFDAQGNLLPDSPQRADALTRLSVAYTPGAPTLLVF